MKKIDRDFFSELILIIAGFILGETIVRKFLEYTQGITAWWVLPLLAIGLITLAIGIKNGEKERISNYYSWLMFILLILFVSLYKKSIIGGNLYIILTLGVLIIYFIIFLVEIITK